MSVESGFDDQQSVVNVPPDAMVEARRRRDVFIDAFETADDADDAWASGSLARGTHKDPIHDVDVVVVFADSAHPDWGQPGSSAEDALEHTRELAKTLLGTNGSEGVEIRHTLLQNHAVKCFLDDPDDPNAFTVDLAPALVRTEGGIWIPEQDSKDWVPSDPKHLMRLVDERHARWNRFAKLVRVLKRWNADHGQVMKSLVVEVLALDHLPEADRPVALQRFFTAAASAVWSPVVDPTNLCGEIQPDLDRQQASELLRDASDLAWRAVDAQSRGAEDEAMCLWRQLFGDIYPEPTGGCDGTGEAAVTTNAVAAVPLVRSRRPIRDAPQG